MDIIKVKEQIVQACTSNSISTVLTLLSQHDDDDTTLLLNEPMSWFDSDGMEQITPPLFIAIDYGHVDLVREMVTLLYNKNANSEEHHHDEDDNVLNRLLGGDGEYTPLQWASSLVCYVYCTLFFGSYWSLFALLCVCMPQYTNIYTLTCFLFNTSCTITDISTQSTLNHTRGIYKL